jgi:transglutaminase superfamily protein
VPAESERGVHAVLRRVPATCLHRAAVLQAWHAAHGQPRDLVIGVSPPSKGFTAHAWLAGESSTQQVDLEELLRIPASPV